MPLIALYLSRLFIAPHVWWDPLLGVRVDVILFPAWLVYVVLAGRLLTLVRFRAQDWFFLAFILWSALGVLVNGPSEQGQRVVFYLCYFFMVYRLTVASASDMTGVRRTSYLLVLFALVLSVESIQHYHSPDGRGWAGQSLGWVNEAAAAVGLDRRTRWVYIFDGPGVFCIVFTVALPFLVQYLVSPYGWFTRVTALIPTGVLLLAIFYNGSRGGWITTLVILGAWWALRRGISTSRLAIGGALALLIMMAGPSYLTSTRDSSHSAQNRVYMWAEGLEMAQQNPVFGIGRGRFFGYTGRLIAHNSAVEIMGEAGLVGLGLWVAIFYCGFKTLRAAMREADQEQDRACALALTLSIGGYIVSSMFVTLEYETQYFLLGLSATCGETLEHPPAFEPIDGLVITGIAVGFYVLLKVFVMSYGG